MARKISNILNTLFLENANAITFEYNPETGSASFLSCDSENRHISKTVKDFFDIDFCTTLKIHPEDCAMIQGKLLEASRTPTKQASLVFRLNYFTPQYQYHQIQYASTALNNNPHRCRIIAIITNIQTQFQQKLVHDELAMSISNLPNDISQGLPVSQQVFEILYRTTDTHLAISSILGVLGRAFHTDRVYIFEDSEDHSTCSNTYEWCAAGISAEKDNLQNLSYHDDLGDRYHDNFSEEGIFLCQDIKDLPKEQRDILEPQGVLSMLQCAITENGIFSGYIGFDSCTELRHWSDDQVSTLMQVTRVLGTFLSKSRRESKIIESNRMFKEMLDLIPGGIVVFEQKQTGLSLVYLNSGYYSLFGLRHDWHSKPIIDDFLGPIHPDDLELVRSSIRNSTSESPLIDITYRVRAKDNEFKWIRIDGNMTTDQRNGLRYLYCICTDINENMKQQEALERDKALLNLAIKAARMNWWEYDAETHAIHYEDNNYSSNDVPELLIEKKIIHPSSAEDARSLFKGLSELKGGSRQAEVQLLDKDLGAYVWKKIIITPRFDKNLSRIMYLGTSIDITEQKRLKDNYMMQIHDLENFNASNLIAKARYCLSHDSLEYWHQSENSIDFHDLDSFEGGKLKTAELCVDPKQKQAFLSIFEKKETSCRLCKRDHGCSL